MGSYHGTMISSVYNRVGGKSRIIGRSANGSAIYAEVLKSTPAIRANVAHGTILNPVLEGRYQDDCDERSRRGLRREKPKPAVERQRFEAVDVATLQADTIRQSLRHLVSVTVKQPAQKSVSAVVGVNRIDHHGILRPITTPLDIPSSPPRPTVEPVERTVTPHFATVTPRRAIGIS